MKFPQLAVGTRFRYRGEIYCKSSPLAATGPDGGQRMIPRSASVEVVEGTTSEKPAATPLQQALAEHHALARELLSQAAAGGSDALEPLLQRLDTAYEALLHRLG